jgi:ketosteroid isomerase-like protein
MKTCLKNFVVLFLAFALSLAGCAAPATPTPAPIPVTGGEAAENPLAKVVLNMAERLNAGDLEGSLNYFADDAITYFVGLPPTGMEIYHGKEGIRPTWKDCIDNHFKMEVEIVSVVGEVVNARSKTWHDFTRQLGVAPNEFVETYVVKDGKITLYSSVITGESLAKLKPALAAVMPPEPTATPSTDTPVSEITVTIADGTCSYTGSKVLQAGEIKVNVDAAAETQKTSGLTFFSLEAGKDLLDLMAATSESSPPAWSNMLTEWQVGSGASRTYSFTATQGPLYLICWSKPPDLAVGNVGPLEVTGATR